MFKEKILSFSSLPKIISKIKKSKKKIVFTNGCFDILHIGHITYLNKAKKQGDILFIGLNSDSSVKSIKGPKRPINNLAHRLQMLASLECVNYVCPFSQSTPLALIKIVKPDILIKGADWKHKDIVGSEFVKDYGGKVKTITLVKGFSTSNLIKKIKSL